MYEYFILDRLLSIESFENVLFVLYMVGVCSKATGRFRKMPENAF